MVEPEILDEEEVTEELVEDVRIALKALEEALSRNPGVNPDGDSLYPDSSSLFSCVCVCV